MLKMELMELFNYKGTGVVGSVYNVVTDNIKDTSLSNYITKVDSEVNKHSAYFKENNVSNYTKAIKEGSNSFNIEITNVADMYTMVDIFDLANELSVNKEGVKVYLTDGLTMDYITTLSTEKVSTLNLEFFNSKDLLSLL